MYRPTRLFTRPAVSAVFAILIGAQPLAALAVPSVGAPAPDFVGTDSNAVQHHLSELRGKTVVLEWTSHECPFVHKHYGTGNMQALQKEAIEQDIVWLSIISSAPGKDGYVTPNQANELTASRNAAPTAVLLDPQGAIGRLYGAKTTPHMFVVDAQGILVYMGGIDDKPSTRASDVKTANNFVRLALNALADGRPVDPAVTRPYGCSVKY